MDEILLSAYSRYYDTLEKTGYLSYQNAEKLLILSFIRDFVYHDFRGILSKEDYMLIERALDCIYGTTCLMPYPDYLKMGKLYLGEITEIAQRVKAVEDTNVLKLIHDTEEAEGLKDSDVFVMAEE